MPLGESDAVHVVRTGIVAVKVDGNTIDDMGTLVAVGEPESTMR